MARLPTSGVAMVAPHRDEGELERVLSDLRVEHSFDNDAARELYWKLGAIIGQWWAEEQRLDVAPVAKALLSTAKNLREISVLLSGHETGFHTDLEIAVTSQTASFLARDPIVGSLAKAQEIIATFHTDASRIAHACMIAYVDLRAETGSRGRPALDWYDDFTALLLDVASRADIAPTLRKDRNSRARSGWLLEAAKAFETFLDPWMRSLSDEACVKRLERSRARLRQTERQKHPGR